MRSVYSMIDNTNTDKMTMIETKCLSFSLRNSLINGSSVSMVHHLS